MVDTISEERRSWNMSRIRSKNTKPELVVRSLLHRMGFRFRLHVKDLPGKPDIVLPKYKTVILIHGCFWHRHEGCSNATIPRSRTEWWIEKFQKNTERDRKAISALENMGYRVFVVWECEIKRLDIEEFKTWIHSELKNDISD